MKKRTALTFGTLTATSLIAWLAFAPQDPGEPVVAPALFAPAEDAVVSQLPIEAVKAAE